MTTEERLQELEAKMQQLDDRANALDLGREVSRFANAAARDEHKSTIDEWKRLYWEADRCRSTLWLQNHRTPR